jgi:hypothetical protein
MIGRKRDIRTYGTVGVEGCSFRSLVLELIYLADLMGSQIDVGRVPYLFLFCHSDLRITLFFGLDPDQDPFCRACRRPSFFFKKMLRL